MLLCSELKRWLAEFICTAAAADCCIQVDFNLVASKARVEELEAALSESQGTAGTAQQQSRELTRQVSTQQLREAAALSLGGQTVHTVLVI